MDSNKMKTYDEFLEEQLCNEFMSKTKLETENELPEVEIQDPEPSFMTACRYLVELEWLIDDIDMSDVRKMFTRSIELEREEFGGSDVMVNCKVLIFFYAIRDRLESASHPFKPLHIIENFNRALHYLTIQYTNGYCHSEDDDYHLYQNCEEEYEYTFRPNSHIMRQVDSEEDEDYISINYDSMDVSFDTDDEDDYIRIY